MANTSTDPLFGPSQAHLAAIGQVAMECTYLENTIQELLINLAGIDFKIGKCITTHMPIRSTCDAVQSLALEIGLSETLRKQLKSLMAEAIQQAAKRNAIVHAVWCITPQSTFGKGEATALTFQARGQLKIEQKHLTVKAIQLVVNSIREHNLKIANFRVAYLKSKKSKPAP